MNTKRKGALRIFIIENIFLIITIIVGVSFTIIQAFRITTFSFESAILIILSGLASAQLTNNYLVRAKEEHRWDMLEKTQLDMATLLKN